MFKKISVLALTFLLLLPQAIIANDHTYGPSLGSESPHDFALPDHTGASVTFKDLMGKKGAVVVFVRSADWCPYCQQQLLDFDSRYNEFKEAGYNVVSVSYDSAEDLAKFQAKYDIPFALLSDTDSDSIKAFGILNETHTPGSRFYGIPHPGVFVIDRNMIITQKFSENGYRTRPGLDKILDALR